MNINLTVKEVSATPYRNKISVNLCDIDVEEVVSEISMSYILDEIGREEAIKHFGIIEEDNSTPF